MPDAGMSGGFAVTEDALAKINLALHVTGQRADGYHLLDMLVTFARHGDRLAFAPSPADELTISGRFGLALDLDPGGNLVLKARDMLRQAALAQGDHAPPVHIHLEKNLPIASGIGGGSADAAAALRGLLRLWSIHLPDGILSAIAVKLGADVLMCLTSRPLIARGIGEKIEPVALPSFVIVLANPLKAVSTPEIFRLLTEKHNPPLDLRTGDWLATIEANRNDLEPAARKLVPEIGQISTLLKQAGAKFVRMSGSGATCFGIFGSIEAAEAAAAKLHSERPDWYFQATETLSGD
ncbi:4-(cytidine 5'-diphospho)-2-C-methyl-D-erythritol kinase [Rhizobium sp. P32RR-XVIII]|uniref:4-(cytidine 5'-diphospho)-2-C-methyl-D-erythritol kinase n=1 Tax=Rhizobium sp. P32RR-XVIII TaxID=2726738 RepID=UPI001457459C|nr:4-(cytidine 5'-diphospho)-2-C-methyl-D-erythritol kinase [Rhizobium sp. P32RR-XVIII]NLS02563.1 4-(cytidine 5'-diphospho)-2-C-methyl-D-erythritol kinase [Rhizobium sp. P32RR-XVIII]